MNPNDTRQQEEAPVLQEQTLLQEITPASPETNTESAIKELPDISVPLVTKQYLKAVKQMIPSGNHFYFTDGISKVEVKVISDEIIRIRLGPLGEFLEEFSYAIGDYKFHITRIETLETNEHFIIATNAISCKISKSNFHVSFHDLNEVLLNEDAQPMHWEEHVQYGGYYVFSSKTCMEGEHFFGLGDKPMNLDLLNKRVQNWGSDAYNFERGTDPLYKNIPFYIGIHHGISYGIFFDNTYRTFFDFAHEETDKVSFWSDGGEMQYYFIAGPHMMDVTKRYAQLTGTHPMAPKWALGFHQLPIDVTWKNNIMVRES